jgi:nucleoside-diphosphate-sugar epimerase
MILGASGKVGPSLAGMISRSSKETGVKRKIYGVARFSTEAERDILEKQGIITIAGDLLETSFLRSLPECRNVFFLAGLKFGTAGNLPVTWAMNSFLPGMVAEQFRSSRIVVFSTGCVYPLSPVDSGGSTENDAPFAVGEYAQSCLGRERMFEYGSLRNGNKVVIIRLNYSVELRYGVLADIGIKVKTRSPVDLSMGYFNIIWQGDMNRHVIRSLELASSPAKILNVTGPEILSVRETAIRFGELLGVDPVFLKSEERTALLSNAGLATDLFGKPSVNADLAIRWTAEWLKDGKRLLDKPTHFEVRDGIY